MTKISDHAAMKLNNQLTVLKQIRENGPISRVELQKRTRLGWGTITSSIKVLLAKEIVREVGCVGAGLGRRPVGLDMNTDRNYVLGLQLGSYAVRSVLVDIKGKLVTQLELDVDASGTKSQILSTLCGAAKRTLAGRSLAHSQLAGIGIAAPGAVDFRTGICRHAPHHPKWRNVALKDAFENEFGIPCFVDHVSNCSALSEKLFGVGRELDNFVCVLLGTGVSAGIVIGGEVYRGADCFSGEFGHTCITIDGPLCACGNRGCVEAYTSGAALARMALERGLHRKAGALRSLVKGEASRITGELLFRAAKQGDRSAAKIFRDMGTYLGIAVSNLINLLNPESIILEGGVSRASEFFLPTLVETTQKRGWQGSRKSIRISTLENGPALGAAAIVLQEIFNRGQIVQRTPVQK